LHTFALLFVLAMASPAPEGPRDEEVVVKQIRSLVETLRKETGSFARYEISREIANEVGMHPDARFGAGLVAEVTDLLTHESDAVRYWIALALGQMRAQAKDSIPALERALLERPGKRGVKTSAVAIRVALQRIRDAMKR
jgi:hypothetical protein